MRRTLLPTIALAIAVSGATAVTANAGDRGGDRDKPGRGQGRRATAAGHGGGHGGGIRAAAIRGGGHPGGGHGGGGGGTPQKTATATGTGGAAATVDVLATDAAIDTLRSGGNAVDAAVAAAGVLGVTEPFSAGIGGGGFMVIRTPRGQVTTIDGRETSGAAMKPDSFWENGVALPFNDARYSGLSAGVPGTVAKWDLALRKYGSKPLRKLLEPGIRVASKGFTVDQTFVDQTTPNVDYFNDVPATAADLPGPGRHPAGRGQHARRTRIWPRRTSTSGATAPTRSTAARWPRRSPTRRRRRRSRRTPTTCGARA